MKTPDLIGTVDDRCRATHFSFLTSFDPDPTTFESANTSRRRQPAANREVIALLRIPSLDGKKTQGSSEQLALSLDF
jgi:hypothetical protein